MPDPRLLIVGAGHCGRALYDLARLADFDLWVQDARAECFADSGFVEATVLNAGTETLERAFGTERAVYAVLLNRDYLSDIEALRVLAGKRLAFLGMMGSAKRIAEVRAAVPELDLSSLVAPVGLDIGAETPHEIAISILAQLVQVRRRA